MDDEELECIWQSALRGVDCDDEDHNPSRELTARLATELRSARLEIARLDEACALWRQEAETYAVQDGTPWASHLAWARHHLGVADDSQISEAIKLLQAALPDDDERSAIRCVLRYVGKSGAHDDVCECSDAIHAWIDRVEVSSRRTIRQR